MTKQAKQVVEVSAGGDIIITNPTHGAEVYASAPELLEACEKSLLYINSEHREVKEQLGRVIAKAKGDV